MNKESNVVVVHEYFSLAVCVMYLISISILYMLPFLRECIVQYNINIAFKKCVIMDEIISVGHNLNVLTLRVICSFDKLRCFLCVIDRA